MEGPREGQRNVLVETLQRPLAALAVLAEGWRAGARVPQISGILDGQLSIESPWRRQRNNNNNCLLPCVPRSWAWLPCRWSLPLPGGGSSQGVIPLVSPAEPKSKQVALTSVLSSKIQKICVHRDPQPPMDRQQSPFTCHDDET